MLPEEQIHKNVTVVDNDLNLKRDELLLQYQQEMDKLRHLHENEKNEKENILKQIEAIRKEYDENIKKLNMEISTKKKEMWSEEEIVSRIGALKAAMIGGEKADDKELSDRRKKKKLAAEERARYKQITCDPQKILK